MKASFADRCAAATLMLNHQLFAALAVYTGGTATEDAQDRAVRFSAALDSNVDIFEEALEVLEAK